MKESEKRTENYVISLRTMVIRDYGKDPFLEASESMPKSGPPCGAPKTTRRACVKVRRRH